MGLFKDALLKFWSFGEIYQPIIPSLEIKQQEINPHNIKEYIGCDSKE